MKKLTALILSAALICTLFIPPAHASNRYNPDDWRYIEDQVAVPSFPPESPDRYYGGNCIYFVRHVCLSEDRGELPKYNGGAHRELNGLTPIEGGQWLNDVHGDERVNRGPTSAEVKAVFANAQSGDVVQMHWGGSSRNTQHTALINDIDENGVTFFQSHVEKDSKNICGFKCSSNYYDWNTLSSRYSYSATNGGLSIYSFNNVTAKNELRKREKTFSITMSEKPVILTEADLPAAYTYTQYDSVTLQASGTPAPSWSVAASSSLPVGMSLSSKGVLSGKPTKAGTFKFSIKATNSAGSSTKKFTLVVQIGDPIISTSSLPNARVGVAYSKQLSAKNISGGAWAATSALPPGLTLSKSGLLSGTPKKSGTYTIYARAINKTGTYFAKSFTLMVKDGIASISTTKLSNATVGKKYSATLKAKGTVPVSWYPRKTLPIGLTLSADGQLIGTPQRAGTYSVDVRAIDTYGEYVNKTLTLNIVSDLKITTSALKNAISGQKYKVTLKASGATAKAWYAVTKLPSGLTLSSGGVLSGTPRQAGTYSIHVRVLDVYGAYVDKTLELKIVDNLSIVNESLSDATVGKSYKVVLQAKSSTAVSWYSTTRLPSGLTLSSKGILSGVPACKGSYSIKLKAINSYGTYVYKTLTLTVGGDDNNSAKRLSYATVNTPYEENFSVSFPKSSGTITWTLSPKLPNGLSLDSIGPYATITGTPTVAGVYRIKATLKDEAGKSVYKWILLTVDNNLTIKTASLPVATLGKAYKATLEASGAKSFVWRAVGLPKGLTCSPSGVISGTPLSEANNDIHLYAYSPNGLHVDKYLPIKVNEGLKITTKSLPVATLGKAYKTTLKATGADSFVWEAYGNWGNWPKGLTCSPSGVISGTPLSSGTYTINVYAYSPTGQYVNKSFTLKVNGSLKITTSSLPDATKGKSYSAKLKASGADSFVWRAAGLPKGLTCSPSGVISGTPLNSGTYSYVDLYAYSPNGLYVSKCNLTLEVNEGLKITTKSLPDATAGKAYKTTLKANGADSFVWIAYRLPKGLTCSPSGVISGTPWHSGEYSDIDFYANSPNGLYAEKYLTLKVNEAAASTKKGSAPSTAPTTESTDGTQKQNQEQTDQSSITFGKNRSLSSIQADKNSPSSEALRKLSDGGYVIAAVLPEVQVTKDGMYDFSISLDKSVPEGSKLLWRSMPLNGEDISDDDGGAVFRNSEGAEISEIPNGHEVSVSAWLRAGITYGPVVAAKTAGNSEVKVSEIAEIEDAESESEKRSTSAGCNGGLAGVISLAFLLFVKERRTCDKLCK